MLLSQDPWRSPSPSSSARCIFSVSPPPPPPPPPGRSSRTSSTSASTHIEPTPPPALTWNCSRGRPRTHTTTSSPASSESKFFAGAGDGDRTREAIFYSYTRHINGFAANLDAAAAAAAADIARQPGVVSVFPNRGHKLHTTRSWQFLGLAGGDGAATGAWKKSRFGEDTIIGNLDTGAWPESQSFRDDGLGPVPSQWKGECQKGQDDTFSCNRKLIGARFSNKGYASAVGKLNTSLFDTPHDSDDHGTHTLSTAGGSPVAGASVFGFGNGTASGGSPRARVAAYRVCYTPVNGSECFDADILAAFDAAIHDGVHVLSVSLGGDAGDYFADGLTIGSLHDVRRGVAVVCSAGNSGPAAGTVSNIAPWIFTAAASTMDREFPSYFVFNNTKIKGQSLSASSLSPAKSSYAMIDSSQATAPNRTLNESRLCFLGALDPAEVKGKIVVCLRGINPRVEKGEAVKQAGGAGMVLANDVTTGNEIIADAHVLPATHIKLTDGQLPYSCLKNTKRAEGTITRPETMLGAKPAPFMAAFSSKGPNKVTPSILKPDITAPGVSVVAAWTRAAPRRLQLRVRDVHVVPPRRRRRRPPPHILVPRRHPLGDHDHRHRPRRRRPQPHPQLLLRRGEPLRLRRRTRVPGEGYESGLGLRHRRQRLPRFPLLAPVQRDGDGDVQFRRAVQVPGESDDPGARPQLPVDHRRQPHRLRRQGGGRREANGEERGEARDV